MKNPERGTFPETNDFLHDIASPPFFCTFQLFPLHSFSLSLILVIGSVGVARAASIGSPAPFNIKILLFDSSRAFPRLSCFQPCPFPSVPSQPRVLAIANGGQPYAESFTANVGTSRSPPSLPSHLPRALCFVNNRSPLGRPGTANLRTVRQAVLFGDGPSMKNKSLQKVMCFYSLFLFCFAAAVVASILRLCPWCDLSFSYSFLMFSTAFQAVI